jgi:hypothetical protein
MQLAAQWVSLSSIGAICFRAERPDPEDINKDIDKAEYERRRR